MKNPCVPNCPERSRTCHAECDRYTAFYASRRAANAANLEEKGVTAFRTEQVLKTIDRNEKRRNRKHYVYR